MPHKGEIDQMDNTMILYLIVFSFLVLFLGIRSCIKIAI